MTQARRELSARQRAAAGQRLILLALVACCAVLAPARAAERFRFVVFPFRGDNNASVDDRRAFDHEQRVELGLQKLASIDVCTDSFIPLRLAAANGYLTKDEANYLAAGIAMSPALALKIVSAVSYDPRNRYDAAVWAIATRNVVEGETPTPPKDGSNAERDEALEVHIVDRVSRLHHWKRIDNADGAMYGATAVYVTETLAGLRGKGKDFEGAEPVEAPAPPDGGTTSPPGGSGTTEPTGDGGTPPGPGGLPGDGGGPAGLSQADADSRLTEAASLEQAGRFADAIALLEPVVGAPGLRPETLWNAAFSIALYHQKLGDVDAALRALDTARTYAVTPEQENQIAMTMSWVRASGSIDHRKTDEYKAMPIPEILNWLVTRHKDDAARVALAERYMEQRPQPDWTRALDNLETVSLEHPWDQRVLMDTGHCLLALNRAAKAAELFDSWRLKRPDSFDEDALRLLIDARLRSSGSADSFAALGDLLRGREQPLTMADADMPRFADAVEAEVRAAEADLAKLLVDTYYTVTGIQDVERTRIELREATGTVDARLERIVRVLDAVAPPDRWLEWHSQLSLCANVFPQAVTEIKYALDLGSADACTRAKQYHDQALELGTTAMEQARPAATPPAPASRPPADQPDLGGGPL
jgi:tetratricopeptide (TPR) repeat protein